MPDSMPSAPAARQDGVGRADTELSVLCAAQQQQTISRLILRETTTLGVRALQVPHRQEARREIRTVETPCGPVRLKLKWLDQELAGAMPEYEDCLRLAQTTGTPVRQVWEAALAAGQLLVRTPPVAQPQPGVHEDHHHHEGHHHHDHDHDHHHGHHDHGH